MCFIFHKWSKWESYTETGTMFLGRIAPKALQGKELGYTELRQKRECTVCGKVQDEKIKDM